MPFRTGLRRSLAYIAAVGFDKGFSIITIPLMAHFLAPDAFGRLDVAVSLIEFTSLIFTLGLANTVVRFASGQSLRKDQRRCAAELLGAGLVIVAVCALIVQLIAPWLIALIGIAIETTAVRWGLAGAAATGLIELPLMWLRFRDQAWRFFAFISVRAVAQAGATVGILYAGGGAEGVLIANAAVALSFAGVLLVSQIRRTGLGLSRWAVRSVGAYGLPLVGGLLAMFALGNCDRWFLSGTIADAEIAFYGLAVKLGIATALATQPFMLWWNARRLAILSRRGGLAELAVAWGRGVSLLLISGLFVALAAPVFIHLAFPEAYARAIVYLPFIVAISVLNELCTLTNTGAYAASHGLRVMLVNTAGAAVALALYALLIPAYGAFGAVAATIAGHLARLGLFVMLGESRAPVAYPWAAFIVAAGLTGGLVALAPPAEAFVLRAVWTLAAMAALAALLHKTGLAGLPAGALSGLRARLSR
jgi:O-antigen/teichoic acid export membrane protein